jgi:hypothetical protein
MTQLSLFLENKPGHLQAICRTLAKENINIVTLSIADTQSFGIVRLIVEDWRRAKEVLTAAGYAVNVRDVVAATVPDRPGGMLEVMQVIEEAGVNIDYMYAFAFHHRSEAVLVFRFDNSERAIEALKNAGRTVLDESELFAAAK